MNFMELTGTEFLESCKDKRKQIKGKVQKPLQMYEFTLPKLPPTWVWASVSDICERVSVGHVGPTTEYFVESSEGIPLIRSQDVRPGRLMIEDAAHVQYEFHKKLKKSQLRSGDVLIVRVGANRGDVCSVPEGLGEINCANIVFARPLFPNGYLSYYLQSEFGREILLSITTGSAQGVLNTQMVARLPIAVPPLETQRKIAAILSAYHDLIENNTRRIKLLEQAAHDLYREWFVHFRFPGHESVEMVDSGTDYGMIPQGWEVVPLQEIAEVNASNIRTGDDIEEIEYIDISSVSSGQIDETRLISFDEAPSRARRKVAHGDTIWATVRPNRRQYALILHPSSNLIASTGFAVITPVTVNYSYLYEMVTTEEFADYLTNRATGAAYPAVNTNDFDIAQILLPTNEILGRFHKIVADMHEDKHTLQKKNSVLREARDLLLPRLVSGDMDVSNVEIEVQNDAV